VNNGAAAVAAAATASAATDQRVRPLPGGAALADPVTLAFEVHDLRYTWPGAAQPVLDIAHWQLARGDSVFLHGESGSGKSTLLALLAGVLRATQGRVSLLGSDWAAQPASRRDRHRADHVGLVFQQFNLLGYLPVIDNVLLPCRFSPRRADRAARADGSATASAGRLLAAMGLDAALWRRAAGTLSVGQQQRVAAARALIGAPELVLADEPTSALDDARRDDFLALLLGACREHGSALVFVSHDARLAERFAQRVALASINRAGRAAA
jgi:putative ABC transport system ATP-binding protein